jgi:hypothetical protein
MGLSAGGAGSVLVAGGFPGPASGDDAMPACPTHSFGDGGDAHGSGERAVPSEQHRPMRFRSGRWFLLAEGLLISELACFAVTAEAFHPGSRPVGGALFGLVLTPVRIGLLFVCGVAAILATLNRRAALVVTAIASVGLLALTTIGDIAAADSLPHKWGIDPHNAGLYAVLLTYNFALLVWMIPNTTARSRPVMRRVPWRAAPATSQTGSRASVIAPPNSTGWGPHAFNAPDAPGADVNRQTRRPELRKPQ